MTWQGVVVLAAAASLALAGPGARPVGGSGAYPDPASRAAAEDGAAYLETTQGSNGAVAANWRADQVGESVLALLAGDDPSGALPEAIAYLEQATPAFVAGEDANGPRVARILAAVVAAGRNPRAFAGLDLVAEVEAYYVPATGNYGGENIYADAVAMLGLLAAGRDLPGGPVNPIRFLRDHQCANGGWSHQLGCLGAADTDTTAMAMSVLASESGVAAEEVRRARQWLLDTQDGGGCWGYTADTPGQPAVPENANSCSLAVTAVVALGEDPGAAPWVADHSPPARLRQFQLPSGAFRYLLTTGANTYATVQGVIALSGWSYPVSAPPAPAPGTPPTPGGGQGSPGSGGGPVTGPTQRPGEGAVPNERRQPERPDEPAVKGAGSAATTTSAGAPSSAPGRGGTFAWPESAGTEDASSGPAQLAGTDGRRPVVVRQAGDTASVAGAGLLATGALATVSAGAGVIGWRRRAAGLL